MRKLVKIVPEEEYQTWLKEQKSYYETSVRGKDFDPRKGEVLDSELSTMKEEFDLSVEKALSATDEAAKTVALGAVGFDGASATLTAASSGMLDNLTAALNKYPKMTIEITAGAVAGEAADAQALSAQRAKAIADYLLGKGIATNRVSSKGAGETTAANPGFKITAQ